MAKITYSEQTYECRSDESVLQCLARHGVELSSSCRAGVCQTCMVVATDGIPPAAAQKGLKPQLQQQGYFLACICTPEQDLTFAKPDDTALPKITATVVDKLPLNDTILRLRIKPETPIDFHPGQFLNLHREDELIRSYSIASLPDEENIELHIELIENGRMSGWLHDDVAVGETITTITSRPSCERPKTTSC